MRMVNTLFTPDFPRDEHMTSTANNASLTHVNQAICSTPFKYSMMK